MEEAGSLRHQGERPVPRRLRGWGHQDRLGLEQSPLQSSWPVRGSPCPLESMGEQRTLEQGSGIFPWSGDGQDLHPLTWEPSWASRTQGDKTSPNPRCPARLQRAGMSLLGSQGPMGATPARQGNPSPDARVWVGLRAGEGPASSEPHVQLLPGKGGWAGLAVLRGDR